ncbi:MAG: hypothetical protein EKK34_15430 [Mycobacterium sp.]|nr:MAG: hypothetical protein EKK34_15430 [Mycobacterium sp.]
MYNAGPVAWTPSTCTSRHNQHLSRSTQTLFQITGQRTRPGQLHVSHSEDLTPARYQELRHP